MVATLVNRDNDYVDMNRAWEYIGENIKDSATDSLGNYSSKQQKPWCGEECTKLFYQRKQTKREWLQYSSHTERDNMKKYTTRNQKNFQEKNEV